MSTRQWNRRALEVAKSGVAANTVSLGFIATKMVTATKMISSIPVGAWVTRRR